MVYTATGGRYFVKRVIWLVLTVITLGIYALLFRPVREQQFLVEHLHFVGEKQGNANKFHGGWMDYFLVRMTAFALMFTFIGIPFGISMLYNFRYANWEIDGKRFVFHGTWNSILARTAYWLLLTVCTVGLWAFFAKRAAYQRWITENLVIDTSK